MERVYFQQGAQAAAAFRSGSAGRIDVEAECEVRSVSIDPNGYHALIHFGVLERLKEVPHDGGPLAPGGEVLFFPASVEALIARLYAAERLTYSGEHDILVRRESHREFRLQLDRRAYQRTLIRLIDLLREAAHEGHAIRLTL